MNEDNNLIHNHAALVDPGAQKEAEIFEFYYQSSDTYAINEDTG